MDFYQQYDMLCAITLCSEELEFIVGDLQFFGRDYGTRKFMHKLRFLYDVQEDSVTEIEGEDDDLQPEENEEGFTYIDNIVNTLNDFEIEARNEGYTLDLNNINDITATDLNDPQTMYLHMRTHFLNNEKFVAISRYFSMNFDQIRDCFDVQYEKLYLMFIIPNQWQNNSIIRTIIFLLLENIGVVVTSLLPNQERVFFMTHLEASLMNTQLYGERNPGFIRQENRCLIYDLKMETTITKMQMVFFQLKEEPNISGFYEKFYVPKVLQSKGSPNFNDINLKHALEHFLFNETLQEQKLITSRYRTKDYSTETRSVASYIMDDVLSNIITYLEKGKLFDDKEDVHYDEKVLRRHLAGNKIEKIKSRSFIEEVTSGLRRILNNQVEYAVQYIDWQNRNIPFLRKWIIVNGCFKYKNQFQDKTSRIFYYFLEKEILHRNRHVDLEGVGWYFITDGLHNDDMIVGAFSSVKRRTMVMNDALKPIVIEKTDKSNSIGLLLHCPVTTTRQRIPYAPERIICIDVSLRLTNVVDEKLDQAGYTVEQLDLVLEERLSSFEQFFESGFIQSTEFDRYVSEQNRGLTDIMREKLRAKKILQRQIFPRKTQQQSSEVTLIQLCLESYLRHVFSYISTKSTFEGDQSKNIGYVVCLEKRIMECLGFESRNSFLEFLETKGLTDLLKSSNKVIIRDHDEKVVWDMFTKGELEPPAYYVHSYISDDHIYAKLFKLVDITESNGGVADSTAVFILDKVIPFKNLYSQLCEKLWSHMQSLDHLEMLSFATNVKNSDPFSYRTFCYKCFQFLKEELFKGQPTASELENLYSDAQYTFEISEDQTITISVRQLLDIAMKPVLQNLVIEILSPLLDVDVFGYYHVSKLYITGSVFSSREYNHGFNYIITQELIKGIDQYITEKMFNLNYYLCVNSKNLSPEKRLIKQKSFCYDIFTKGELSIVSSSTYLLSNSRLLHKQYFQVESEFRNGQSFSLVLRGNSLLDKRVWVEMLRKHDYSDSRGEKFGLELYRYSEPRSKHEIDNADEFVQLDSMSYNLAEIDSVKNLITIHMEILHYRSCIRITCEKHYVKARKLESQAKCFIFGEKQTLRYF